MPIKPTYNAIDYKALLKKAVLFIDEYDRQLIEAYFSKEDMKVLDKLIEEVYDERD